LGTFNDGKWGGRGKKEKKKGVQKEKDRIFSQIEGASQKRFKGLHLPLGCEKKGEYAAGGGHRKSN